jgi:ATP-dependent RNA helicase RhlB
MTKKPDLAIDPANDSSSTDTPAPASVVGATGADNDLDDDADYDDDDYEDDDEEDDDDDITTSAGPRPGTSRYAPPQTEVAFEDLNLPEPIIRSIRDTGFTHCTPIQAKTLPLSLKGEDVAGQAQTGTGKTAAFLITIFKELLETERNHPTAPRAVIVAPTRELALQIAKDAETLGRHCHFRTVAVFGGMDWEKQAKVLEGTVDIVVGTPGRMMDYMKRGMLHLRHVQVVVIDEADRMFDMGFVEDIRYMLGQCAKDRQTMLFSATLTYDVMNLASRYMRNPVEIRIAPEQITAKTVEQLVFHVPERSKLPLLLWILEEERPKRALIFCNTKRAGEWLDFKLFHNGWECQYMSGDVAQKKRLKLVEDFRSGAVEILVATDVVARGLHVDDVDLVVNFDLPGDIEDYVHRIGRTGRAGQKGKAITLADEANVERLPAIEKYIGLKIPSTFPTPEQFMDDLSPSFRETQRLQAKVSGKPLPGRGGPAKRRRR